MKYKNIAAAWIKKDKNGNSFISLKVETDLKEGQSISLFKNDKAGNEKRPDYRAYEKIEETEGQEFTSEQLADDIPW